MVILGEVHHRQRYWVFNAALVRSPKFAQHVGVIYLELPYNDQPLIDQFLAAPKYDPAPVIDVLRDMFAFGWPDQATVEFCQAVWEVNQVLRKEQRIRIVLVDMARPWKQIQKRGDWTKYDVDRNELMAKQIERDQREHALDARHAMFIVGYGHASKNLTYPGGAPSESAGWHLCRALGDTNVFAVFPHSPVMANVGGVVDGRLALGLFETAFAALSNRPIAFPLHHGPFGELLFDASSDLTTTDSYRAGFDAFLYLGPLEDEIMSPLVPGFYTDEYAREVDRRSRLVHGQGLESDPEIGQVSGEAIRRQSEKSWGQPWYEWRTLGPLDAWHYGINWKQQLLQSKYREALKDSTKFRREAERLFTVLRQTDYTQDWEILHPLLSRLGYCVESDQPSWVRWVVQHFRTNPIVQVELGAVARHSSGRPAVPYKLVLKDRTKLEGALPFELDLQSETWQAVEGLDWHLGKGKPQSSAGQPVTPEKAADTKAP